jgi:uncharacterized membrane protein
VQTIPFLAKAAFSIDVIFCIFYMQYVYVYNVLYVSFYVMLDRRVECGFAEQTDIV